MPDPAEPNVRSSSYFIVRSLIQCFGCDKVTEVWAFAVPEGHQFLEAGDDMDDDDPGEWMEQEGPAVLYYVEYLPPGVVNRIHALTEHYRQDTDEEDSIFWMNHCQHCGAQMNEEELHGEAESPFGEMPYEGPNAIQVHEVREPFEAWAAAVSEEPGFLNRG